ncbi:hypothetical protein VOH09_004541 [Salmonella enterica]|nr:hypothetical protein [Salmonella enterica]
MAIPPTYKEIFMNTALLVPFISTALSGVGVYTRYYFKKYQASRDLCQKVHRRMVNTLTDTARLFSRSAPAQALKSELRIMQQKLSQETQKLDKMTTRLPLKRLQREQRHILRHAKWLLGYLDSHLANNEGKFFLFLHDLATDSDDKVLDFLTSLHDTKRFRNRRLQTGSTTCP